MYYDYKKFGTPSPLMVCFRVSPPPNLPLLKGEEPEHLPLPPFGRATQRTAPAGDVRSAGDVRPVWDKGAERTFIGKIY
ncbi:MAG: hypothetical protein OHK0029_24830 [Armatimonadaceae bacterium]